MDVDCMNGAKYTLRAKSLLKRIESERTRQELKKREPKEKQKPPPLSKYRRKTANARERNRMREINEAFETLQKTLPDLPGADADKLTKITVLKLAVNYIKILSHVVDGQMYVPDNIEELKNLWCSNNAHMARSEQCVRFPGKEHEETPESPKSFVSKQKMTKVRNGSSFRLSDPLRGTQPTKKKASKSSRNRGKICKTASVATSNGAYITLKNVALQSSGKRPTIDNKPLMMSMTVKRPRMEPMSYDRPPKISRYMPPIQLISKPPVEFRPAATKSLLNRLPKDLPTPLVAVSTASQTPHGISPLDDTVSNFILHDLDNRSSFIKNDMFLELPAVKNCSNSSFDSAWSYASSEPCSPKSPSSFPMLSSEKDTQSTNPSGLLSTTSPSFCSSDTDSVLAPGTDLDDFLGSDPFEEELDHLTSSFTVADDTLGFFLEQNVTGFIGSDINSY